MSSTNLTSREGAARSCSPLNLSGALAGPKQLISLGVLAFGLAGAVPNAVASPFMTCGLGARPGCITPAPGDGVPPPAVVPGKEISTHFDRGIGGAMPEQNMVWDGIGGTDDGSRTEC